MKLTLGMDSAGARGKSIGLQAASANATISARGSSLSSWTALAEAKTVAAAPSLRVLAFAAVTVPESLSKAGLSFGTRSRSTFLNSSSSVTSLA